MAKKVERQQTGKEVAITGILMLVAICMVLHGEGMEYEYAPRTLMINMLGLLVGGVALLYQHYCMHWKDSFKEEWRKIKEQEAQERAAKQEAESYGE